MKMEAPDNYYHHQAGFPSQFPAENKSAADHFAVEDLLDFSNEDDGALSDGIVIDEAAGNNNSTDSSTVTPVDSSCNSSSGGDVVCYNFVPESLFSSELCVPYDAELEWLSNFVEESFSSEDLQKPVPNTVF